MSRIAAIVAVGMAIGMLMLAVLVLVLIAYPLSNLDHGHSLTPNPNGFGTSVGPVATGIPIPQAPNAGSVATGVPISPARTGPVTGDPISQPGTVPPASAPR